MYIGALVLRHADHHPLLRERGWEDVPIEEIGSTVGADGQPTERGRPRLGVLHRHGAPACRRID